MISKDLGCLMSETKGIFFILAVCVLNLSVNNEKICAFNKHHIIFRRYSDLPWNIVCSVGVGLSKHGYGKMLPKRAYVLILGIFHTVHCMPTCTKFEG